MGLKQDFDELSDRWSELSGVWKILGSFQFVISLFSIASIQDHVFRLKGFIVDGIEFYRFIVFPLVDYLLHVLNIGPMHPEVIDTGVLMSFWLIIVIRLLSSKGKIISPIGNLTLFRFFIGIIGLLWMAATLFMFELTLFRQKGNLGFFIPHFLFAFSFILFNSVLYRTMIPLIYFLGPFVIVSFVAGISNGLAK